MCDRLQFTCTILYGILTLVGEFMAKMTWLVLQLVGAMGHMCLKMSLWMDATGILRSTERCENMITARAGQQ